MHQRPPQHPPHAPPPPRNPIPVLHASVPSHPPAESPKDSSAAPPGSKACSPRSPPAAPSPTTTGRSTGMNTAVCATATLLGRPAGASKIRPQATPQAPTPPHTQASPPPAPAAPSPHRTASQSHPCSRPATASTQSPPPLEHRRRHRRTHRKPRRQQRRPAHQPHQPADARPAPCLRSAPPAAPARPAPPGIASRIWYAIEFAYGRQYQISRIFGVSVSGSLRANASSGFVRALTVHRATPHPADSARILRRRSSDQQHERPSVASPVTIPVKECLTTRLRHPGPELETAHSPYPDFK